MRTLSSVASSALIIALVIAALTARSADASPPPAAGGAPLIAGRYGPLTLAIQDSQVSGYFESGDDDQRCAFYLRGPADAAQVFFVFHDGISADPDATTKLTPTADGLSLALTLPTITSHYNPWDDCVKAHPNLVGSGLPLAMTQPLRWSQLVVFDARDAYLYAQPDTATIGAGQVHARPYVVGVLEAAPGWLRVETLDGTQGWTLTSDLDPETTHRLLAPANTHSFAADASFIFAQGKELRRLDPYTNTHTLLYTAPHPITAITRTPTGTLALSTQPPKGGLAHFLLTLPSDGTPPTTTPLTLPPLGQWKGDALKRPVPEVALGIGLDHKGRLHIPLSYKATRKDYQDPEDFDPHTLWVPIIGGLFWDEASKSFQRAPEGERSRFGTNLVGLFPACQRPPDILRNTPDGPMRLGPSGGLTPLLPTSCTEAELEADENRCQLSGNEVYIGFSCFGQSMTLDGYSGCEDCGAGEQEIRIVGLDGEPLLPDMSCVGDSVSWTSDGRWLVIPRGCRDLGSEGRDDQGFPLKPMPGYILVSSQGDTPPVTFPDITPALLLYVPPPLRSGR